MEELCWPAAGRDLRAGDAAGGVEGVIDLAGGLVVMECLADLAAGQPFGMLVQDSSGERRGKDAGRGARGFRRIGHTALRSHPALGLAQVPQRDSVSPHRPLVVGVAAWHTRWSLTPPRETRHRAA